MQPHILFQVEMLDTKSIGSQQSDIAASMKEVLLMEVLSAQCKRGSIVGNTVLAAGLNHSNSSLSLVLWSTYTSRDLPPQV